MIDILHIANDFTGSKIYNQLCTQLDSLGITQYIYTPTRDKRLVGNNIIDFKNKKSKIYFRPIITPYCRINFYHKKKLIFNDLSSVLKDENPTIIHAHTWYSDGAIAYEYKNKYNIPYIISVRSTDINIFLKRMIHLKEYGKKILINASLIICISPAYKKKLLDHPSLYKVKNKVNEKTILIPNGIDDFWLKNINNKKEKPSNPFLFIYVGKFEKRKNVPKLMRSIIILNKLGYSTHLHLAGGGGSDTNRIKKLLLKYPSFFTYHGNLAKEELINIYRMCDAFAMPSFAETFGLVYIEAMSQGLPVLYSKGEGIDGYFPKSYGVACDPNNIESIINGLKKLIDEYPSFQIDKNFLFSNFNWNIIAKKYLTKIEQIRK